MGAWGGGEVVGGGGLMWGGGVVVGPGLICITLSNRNLVHINRRQTDYVRQVTEQVASSCVCGF